MKEFIWKLLPASFKKAWSGKEKNPSGWFGNYPDWQSAQAKSSGYDSQHILGKVNDSLLKVKRGEAAFERDSVAFDKLDFENEIAEWLKQIALEKKGGLCVLDFGGSLGSTYYQYRQVLQPGTVASWVVAEQEHFVRAGNAGFSDNVLRFTDDFRKEKADLLLLFSVLPYLDEPYRMLGELLDTNPEYIIVDRTPVIGDHPDRITVQVVPEIVYKASYPAWFFNENRLKSAFAKKYVLQGEFRSKFASPYTLEDGVKAEWKGYFYKRR